MSWDTVPASHTKLQLEILPQQKIRDWILKNVPQVQYLRLVPEVYMNLFAMKNKIFSFAIPFPLIKYYMHVGTCLTFFP